MSKKLLSPCVNICKYKLRGHCIACSMTKIQKSMFKKLNKKKRQEAFIKMVISQQHFLGTSKAWDKLYSKRCIKKQTSLPKVMSAKVRRN